MGQCGTIEARRDLRPRFLKPRSPCNNVAPDQAFPPVAAPTETPQPPATRRKLPRYRYFEKSDFFLISAIFCNLLSIGETLGSEFESLRGHARSLPF